MSWTFLLVTLEVNIMKWNVWMKYNEKDDITNLFKELCNEPLHITDNHLNILENFVLSLPYPKRSSFKSIRHERTDVFNATPNLNLRSIPFSRKGLNEHTKRACLQSDWLWKEGDKSVDPLEWGWKIKNVRFVPKWQPDKNITWWNDIENLLLFNYM